MILLQTRFSLNHHAKMDKNYVNRFFLGFFMTKKARAAEPWLVLRRGRRCCSPRGELSLSSIRLSDGLYFILVEIFGTKSQLLDFVILTVSSKLMSYRQKVKRRLLLPCLIDQETSLVSETSSQFKILF